MNVKTAYQLLKSRRPVIQPNEGFIQQLMEYHLHLSTLRRQEHLAIHS